MRWWNRYNFPYSNFHDLNLDWIIKEMNRLIEEWEVLKAEWEQMKIDWAEFQAEMQRLWKEYKDLMNAAWEAYKAQMNQEWADYKDEMDAAWDAYQAELNAQWTAYQNNLNAAWLAYQNAINTWKNGVDQDIQDKFDEIDEKCRQCKADVDAAIATLNGLLASVQQQVTDYLNNLPYQSIIQDTTNEWLDEHGVIVNASDFVKPEDFYTEGTTTWTQAIQAAADEARNNNKILYLNPNTTYTTSGVINLYCSVIGNGASLGDATVQIQPNDKFRFIDGIIAKSLSYGYGTKNITMTNSDITELRVASNNAQNPTKDILIDNCKIEVVRLLRNVEDITFRNCNIGLTTDTVIAFLHGYQALNVTLESCTLDAQAQVLNGIVDLGGTQAYEYGLSLIDCVVKNYGNSSQSSTFPISIFTNNYPSSLSRIKVYNLTFDGAGQQGYSKTYNFGTTQMQNVLYLDPLKYDPYNP